MKTDISVRKGGCDHAGRLIGEAIASIPSHWRDSLDKHVDFWVLPLDRLPARKQASLGSLARPKNWVAYTDMLSGSYRRIIASMPFPEGGQDDLDFKIEIVSAVLEDILTQNHVTRMFRAVAKSHGALNRYRDQKEVARKIACFFVKRSISEFVLPPKLGEVCFCLDEMMRGFAAAA